MKFGFQQQQHRSERLYPITTIVWLAASQACMAAWRQARQRLRWRPLTAPWAVAAILTACSAPWADADTQAQYNPAPSMALYLVKDGATPEPVSVRIYNKGRRRRQGDRISLRLFDPEERLVLRQYLEPGRKFLHTLPGTMEIQGVDPQGACAGYASFLEPAVPGALTGSARVLLTGPGVWQLRMVAGDHNSLVNVDTPEGVTRGVSFQNGRFNPWRKGLEEAFLYIPPNARRLRMKGDGVEVFDEQGGRVFPPDDHDPRKAATIPIDRTGVVWTMRFPNPAKWHFQAADLPVILCEDEAAARAIGGSVEVLDDGTVLAHKFQRRMAELLPKLLAPENVGDTAELMAKFDADPEAWRQGDPRRNELLRGRYGFFPHLMFALREQNLSPGNHWSGAIGRKFWEPRLAADTPETRWDGFIGVHTGQGKGAASVDAYAKYLAEAYHLDAPFNPYRGRREMLYRAAAAAFRDLMLLNEAELFPGAGMDLETYPGMPAFVYGGRHFPEFAMAAPHLPAEIRDVWADGLRRIVDRHWPDGLVSARNQSSHFLVTFQNFALGSGDPVDTELAQRFAARFVQRAAPAGYHREAGGPCGTYPGMQHYHMAEYYMLSGDPAMLESIRRSYRFYNHTVAPEPRGIRDSPLLRGTSAYGGYNYSHRIGNGFHFEQYMGARAMLADVLPEVGVWWSRPPLSDRQREEATEKLLAQVGRPLTSRHDCLNLHVSAYKHWPQEPVQRGLWPAEEEPFIRDFGGELLAVKRPSWYAAFYVGKPAGDPFYLYGAHGGTRPGGRGRAFNGGGATIFWTPEFGNAILSGRKAFTRHGLVAVGEDGLRRAEDYFRVAPELDQEAGTLRVAGRIEGGAPLAYRRVYTFHDDRLDVEVTLTATDDFVSERLVENIPLAGGAFKPNGAVIAVAGDEEALDLGDIGDDTRRQFDLGPGAEAGAITRAETGTITLADHNGNGVDVVLDGVYPVRICRHGPTTNEIRHNRVEIELPARMARGETATLRYRIVPRRHDVAPQ